MAALSVLWGQRQGCPARIACAAACEQPLALCAASPGETKTDLAHPNLKCMRTGREAKRCSQASAVRSSARARPKRPRGVAGSERRIW